MAGDEMTPNNGSAPETKPLQRELAYERIKHQIVHAQLPPGTFLSERSLAARIRMGKAPIRSALTRLESEGFVSISPRQGIVVATRSVHDVAELYQMRTAMELFAVRQITGALRENQISRLRENLADYESSIESGVAADYVEVDFAFHRLLCELLGNHQMVKVLNWILETLYRDILRLSEQFPERAWASLSEHGAVVEAIVAGDADEAAHRIAEHLRFGETSLLSGGLRAR